MPKHRAEDGSAQEAGSRSLLNSLPPDARNRLLADAMPLDVPAGTVFYRDEDAPRLALVISGLVRVFLTSADGRQLTVRYARPGDVLGAPTTAGGPVDVSVQAMVDSSVLMLNVAVMRSLAMAQPEVAWSLAEEVTRRLYEVLEAFAGHAFGSVRQRLARHLLDLAAEQQRGSTMRVSVTQQALADATGAARETVARTLRELETGGLVERTKHGIRVVDPERLLEAASSGVL